MLTNYSYYGHKVNSSQNTPWKFWHTILTVLFFGIGAAYLICWQNLKRMGKEQEAKHLFIFGGIAVLAISIIANLISSEQTVKLLGNAVGLAFPTWTYYKYQKQWEVEHPNQSKFTWSLLGWGLLGTVLTIFLFFVIASLIPTPG